MKSVVRKQQIKDAVFFGVGFFALFLCLLTLIGLLADMFIQGSSRLSLDFFVNFPSRRASQAGILSAWIGSFLVMIVTALFSVPVGIASALYLEEYAKKNLFTDLIELNISNLAGVPSIVYGLLALGLFVYNFGFGQSILSAGLALGLLILPIIIVSTREALRSIPQHIREAAYACGASKWMVCKDHLLPYSTPGILTGVIIGLSRAIGETAPVITIGALTFIAFLPPIPIIDGGLFDWVFSAFTVMPIQIFNWTSRPDPAFHVNAAAASMVLVGLTLSMNILAIYIRYKMRKNVKW